jgi:hypothetical protein
MYIPTVQLPMDQIIHTKIWNEIFASLARNPGNAMPVMAQQSLLGYWKGGSTAWVYCEPSALVLFT